jgi:WhiB family transcriptional regulator, redox-sensing transcriptional regulator
MAVVPDQDRFWRARRSKGGGDVSEGIHGWPSTEQAISMEPVLELDIDVQNLPKQVNPPDFWQETAACYGLDPEIFFPTTEEEAGLALSYCGMCSVREVCLAWAVQNGERYGVWGGTTEQHRRRLIRHIA